MSTILTVREVSKVFTPWTRSGGSHKALDRVSLDVAEHELVVVLGSDGAGKTILTNVILDLLRPSAGEVRLFGLPPSDWTWKPEVGYLPESFRVQKDFTGAGFLRHVGRLREMWGGQLEHRIAGTLREFGLSEYSHVPVAAYSKAMMIRLGVGQALLHNPRLLILDEPTDGLDPGGRLVVGRLLQDFRARGGGVLLSSRILSDVEMMADRVMFIERGKIRPVVHRKELFRTGIRLALGLERDIRDRSSPWSAQTRHRKPITLRNVIAP